MLPNFFARLAGMTLLMLQVRLMEERGYQLGNLDATIIAQKPKLSPFKEQIRTNLSQLLGAHPSVINLKVRIEACPSSILKASVKVAGCYCRILSHPMAVPLTYP